MKKMDVKSESELIKKRYCKRNIFGWTKLKIYEFSASFLRYWMAEECFMDMNMKRVNYNETFYFNSVQSMQERCSL